MAAEGQKLTKKIKVKKSTGNELKENQDSELEKDVLKDSKEKAVLKKKLKVKPKEEDRFEVKPKSSKNSGKIVDERLIGVSLEPGQKIDVEKKTETGQMGDERISYLTGKGKPHPVHELIQKLRTILLNSGFNELENQYFIQEKDIFDQYNTKSGIVLDKSFYLAENQRQVIEVNNEQLRKIKVLILDSKFDTKKFLEILNQYNNEKYPTDAYILYRHGN